MRARGGSLFAAAMAVVSAAGCGRLGYDGTAAPLEQDGGRTTMDAGTRDAGDPDDAFVAVHDAGPPDAGPPDAGPPDAGPPDSGPPDAGPPDAGPPDSGPPDAGPSCPADMLLVETPAPYCIEIHDRAAEPFDTAGTICTAAGRHLCTDDEWRVGCEMGGAGFMDVPDDWEWVDLILSPGVAKKRGYTCADTSSHVLADPYPYRCCASP